MRDCSVSLDGVAVVDAGRLVGAISRSGSGIADRADGDG
jgi:hypothetical protein